MFQRNTKVLLGQRNTDSKLSNPPDPEEYITQNLSLGPFFATLQDLSNVELNGLRVMVISYNPAKARFGTEITLNQGPLSGQRKSIHVKNLKPELDAKSIALEIVRRVHNTPMKPWLDGHMWVAEREDLDRENKPLQNFMQLVARHRSFQYKGMVHFPAPPEVQDQLIDTFVVERFSKLGVLAAFYFPGVAKELYEMRNDPVAQCKCTVFALAYSIHLQRPLVAGSLGVKFGDGEDDVFWEFGGKDYSFNDFQKK